MFMLQAICFSLRKGNKRKHVSPDVLVVFGVAKHPRENYLLWEEGRGPNVVIELTSASTRKEDTDTKFALYQDVLKIPEYFLFDLLGHYLNPRFQGYRLVRGQYRPMKLENGGLTSRQLGLVLEPDGKALGWLILKPACDFRLGLKPGKRRSSVGKTRNRVGKPRSNASSTKPRSRAEAEIEPLQRNWRPASEMARRTAKIRLESCYTSRVPNLPSPNRRLSDRLCRRR